MWRMANTGDCRLPDWRFQIADWSMLSQQTGSRGSLVDAGDRDAFVAGFLAGDDADVAGGEGEGLRQERDEGLVGGAVDRRRREPDEQGAAARAVDAGPGRARDHADVQDGRLRPDSAKATRPRHCTPQRRAPRGGPPGAFPPSTPTAR